ncbi:2-oxoglutarate carboxylase large subunit [subsurface metagenome]
MGVQAVQNTLLGPYKFISKEVKDYCWGLYGKPPVPIDPKIQKMVLKGYERGEEPITCRAADMVEPELEKAREAAKDIAKDDKDVLTYALYPTTGMRFLRYKYGLDKEIPSDWKPPRAPKTMEEIKREDELIAKAKAGKLVEKVEKPVPAKGPGLRVYNVFVGDEYYQVEVEPTGGTRISAMPANRPATASAPAAPPKAAPAVAVEGAVLAPMPGMIIRYEAEVGQQVKAGDTVVILEAMKMETTIPAPIDGTIKELRFKSGDRVAKDDVLAVIG